VISESKNLEGADVQVSADFSSSARLSSSRFQSFVRLVREEICSSDNFLPSDVNCSKNFLPAVGFREAFWRFIAAAIVLKSDSLRSGEPPIALREFPSSYSSGSCQ
jgi:hypothetical protein